MPSTMLSVSTAAWIGNSPPIVFFANSEIPVVDKNNNISCDHKSDDYSKQILHGGDCPKENASLTSESTCDDCDTRRSDLILRWCETCKVAVCDACVLDRHLLGEHSVILYEEALRQENAKLREKLFHARCRLNQVSTERKRARHYQREVTLKMAEMERKVQELTKESNEIVSDLGTQLDKVAKLMDVQLNAKVCVYRRHAESALKISAALHLNRQSAIIIQLNRMCSVVSQMYQTIRKDHQRKK